MALDPVNSFTSTMTQLHNTQVAATQSKTTNGTGSPKVVILGAGPAGLMRAIESLVRGNETIVVEKRAEGQEGRFNTVALTEDTVQQLTQYGIYQYLLENGSIFPPTKWGYMSVRIGDLEAAMKAVIDQLSPNRPVICYDTRVVAVDQTASKVSLSLQQTGNSQRSQIGNIDILVNAEGAKSSTNELLGIGRITVLPKVPVIAAIFEDTRPAIVGVCSLVQYVAQTLVNLAVSIYYYTIFFFKAIFQGEWVFGSDRTIAGALILTTPNQNYLGCGFTDEMSKRLIALKQVRDAKKQVLNQLEATAPNGENTENARKEFLEAEEAYNGLAEYWIKLSFCAANIFALARDIYNFFGTETRGFYHFNRAAYLPLKNFQLIEIGADRAIHSSAQYGETAYLIAGDALATVDPTTGLGCNTAVKTSKLFKTFLEGVEAGTAQDQLLQNYNNSVQVVVDRIHDESIAKRRIYRPDAVRVARP
jgi:flavin-dependent dehydrogenase